MKWYQALRDRTVSLTLPESRDKFAPRVPIPSLMELALHCAHMRLAAGGVSLKVRPLSIHAYVDADFWREGYCWP